VDEVLAYQYNPTGADWAIVKLDRNVEGRQPLSIRREGQIQDNQAVYVIGHPRGLPQKYAGNASVRNNQATTHFVANLDVFGGNSGSPVFNDSTHEVEGILVRGDLDFVRVKTCYISLAWPTTGGQGEACTRVTQFSSFI
jgi:V8-like Glu-specific endopeptidase